MDVEFVRTQYSYISHYTLSMLLTNILLVNEADICTLTCITNNYNETQII